MYTYIIIDDERLIRLGLISKIEEISSEKFECIGERQKTEKREWSFLKKSHRILLLQT